MDPIDTLIIGFKRFKERYYQQDGRLFGRLRRGQRPAIMLIGCSDSRVDPALLTDSAPGDLFIVRNVANLVPPYDSDIKSNSVRAAVEFAVGTLDVPHIVVLGHSQCGGIEALIGGIHKDASDSAVGRWLSHAGAVRDAVVNDKAGVALQEQPRVCEQASIAASLRNLAAYPLVERRLSEARLRLHGWYFDLQVGELLGWNADTGTFDNLTAP